MLCNGLRLKLGEYEAHWLQIISEINIWACAETFVVILSFEMVCATSQNIIVGIKKASKQVCIRKITIFTVIIT